MPRARRRFHTIGGSAVLVCAALASAQQPATAPATRPADALVTLDFPNESVELKVLADIVVRRLNIPILYDDSINNKRVIIRVPMRVPEGALLGILQSALKMKQMALVDAEQPGWKQIVPAQNLAAVAKPPELAEAGGAVTQVFNLKNSDPSRLVEIIRPFLTQPGGNIQPVLGQRTLVVSDYPTVMRRIEQVVQLIDGDAPPVETKSVPLKQAEATAVAAVATQLIASRDSFQWGAAGASGIFITADDRSNQVVIVAPPNRMQEVVNIVQQMDAGPAMEAKVYRLQTLTPDRLDRLVRNLLTAGAKKSYSSTADPDLQALIVVASAEVQAQVTSLVKELDVPVTAEQNPIRFYKLKNTKAQDVLVTISGLQTDGGLGGLVGESDEGQVGGGDARTMAATGTASPAADAATATPGRTNGARRTINAPGAVQTADLVSRQRSDADAPGPSESAASRYGGSPSGVSAPDLPGSTNDSASVRTRDATVAADVNTNAIIVIAPPAVQQMYAELINRLDERRPQVQVECTIVTLDTSDNFTFGIDIAKLGGSGDNQLLSFSAFGVSTLDPVTGTLAPRAANGGTFALLSPGNADIVLRALATNSRSRLVSAPQLLVNDNGKGKLQSVTQEPFAEILDTSSTQSRTGLGGQAQAGTTIVVEPHISEGDYLQLTYSIELSSFTGEGSQGLPPPSQKNAVDSAVTIPDGFTIVVGGLSVKNVRTAVNTIPILGEIPVLKYLFGTRSRNITDRTLFVFIKPTILRNDRFEDLKYLSERAVDRAGVANDYPVSHPIPLH